MLKITNVIKLLKRISVEYDVWQIAIRPVTGRKLYEGNTTQFSLIPNSERYWMADPFIFKYKNKNYLFAEMYDRKQGKGVIGVARIKNGKCGPFKVCLELPYHLSYPCVFEQNNQIFMIPECNESGKIVMFRSEKFPLIWVEEKTLLNIAAVDTTPFFDQNGNIKYYFMSKYDTTFGGNDNLYCFKDSEITCIKQNNTTVRCAGHIIHGEYLLRPSQIDTAGYGDALIFNKIENSKLHTYTEVPFLCVKPPNASCADNEISISLAQKKLQRAYTGVHTYNHNSDYEVIDLKVKESFNLYVLWKNKHKVVKKFCNRLKI